jgi:arthrofactin-type cyclic lipopeptide synthetase C
MGAYASRDFEPPQGEIEKALAGIWQELLNVERVGRRDNFFELGGHSLHGIRLIAKVSEKLLVRLSGIAMFRHPTIYQMAEAVQSMRSNEGESFGIEGLQFESGAI